MELSLNEEQLQMHHRVSAFIQQFPVTSGDRLGRQSVIPITLLPKMASAELLAISIPQEYGGNGGDHVSLGLAAEELEIHDTAPREVLTAHTAMCGLSLLRWGSEAQKSRYLTPQSSGAKIGTAAFDVPAEETVDFLTPFTVRRQIAGNDTTYVLHGTQSDVRLAGVADHFLVIARHTDTGSLSAFMVEREEVGVDIDANRSATPGDALPLHGNLSLAGVRVHESSRLGVEGDGAAIAGYAVNVARYTIVAGAIGIIKRCINHSLACIDRQDEKKTTYARFSPMIAQMFRRTEMARRMLKDAFQKGQSDDDASRALSLAHWFATTAAYDSLADATQIQSVCAHDVQPATIR